MIGWKFAFSRRWAGYLALTILFAIVCSGLGMWQLAREQVVWSSADPSPITGRPHRRA